MKNMRDKVAWLWENDPEWAKKMLKICIENLAKARDIKIETIRNKVNSQNFTFNGIKIDYDNINNLKKNDICGAYVIKAKFKDYIGTERENEVFDILVCKSKYVYDEISWVQKVCSQPEKQNWFISDSNTWTDAKWWYISNLYYDFEFELLTNSNSNDVSEEEALIVEQAYGIINNLFVEFIYDNDGNRIPNINKHAYWSI